MYSVWVGQKHQLVYEPSSLWLKKIKAGVCCCMCVHLTGDLLSGLVGRCLLLYVCLPDGRPAFGSCRQVFVAVCVFT